MPEFGARKMFATLDEGEHRLCIVGFVSRHEDETLVRFSKLPSCEPAVDIPEAAIRSFEHLATMPGRDAIHHLVRLHLKKPKPEHWQLLHDLLDAHLSAPLPSGLRVAGSAHVRPSGGGEEQGLAQICYIDVKGNKVCIPA